MARNRPMTPEELEKLKQAREKALEVRRKLGEISRAKKAEKQKQRDEEYQAIVAKQQPKEEPPATTQESEKEKEDVPKKQPAKKGPPKKPSKTKKVLYMDSESSSESSESDSDGSEYDISPIKQKYKAKYKAKYGASGKQQPQGNDYTNDAYTIARQSILNKVSEDVRKIAYSSLFG